MLIIPQGIFIHHEANSLQALLSKSCMPTSARCPHNRVHNQQPVANSSIAYRWFGFLLPVACWLLLILLSSFFSPLSALPLLPTVVSDAQGLYVRCVVGIECCATFFPYKLPPIYIETAKLLCRLLLPFGIPIVLIAVLT